MYRADLYLKNIPNSLPKLGTHKDRILQELYFRTKLTEKEKYETLFVTAIKIISQKLDQEGINLFSDLVDRITGAAWIKNSPSVKQSKQDEDAKLLEKVKRMSGSNGK
jgi:hypothetical protein